MFSSTSILLVLALTSSGVFVEADRLTYFTDTDDRLLRDLPPQDEVSDTQWNEPNFYEIPAQALLEVSQLTSAQFLEKFTPKQDSRIQILPDPFSQDKLDEDDMPLTSQDVSLYNAPSLLLPVDFVPVEGHHPKSPKISPLDMATNFRMARILGEMVPDPPMAENARCVPRETVVPMPKPKNVTLIIWPECTMVKQCGGCCGNNNLQCKPTKTAAISRKGMHLGYVNGKLQIVEQTVVTLSEHTECACQCRQNALDCNALQKYEPGNCRCICLDQDIAGNCGANRVWDAERCECKCPNAGGTCPIGFHFDNSHYCSCISNNTFRQSKISRVKKAQTPFAPAVAIYQMQSLAHRSRSDRS